MIILIELIYVIPFGPILLLMVQNDDYLHLIYKSK